MEQIVLGGIIDFHFEKLKNNLSVGVTIMGGGPSGVVAAYFLAKASKRVALLNRKLAPSGGMWSGTMMFNDIVAQEEAMLTIKGLGISYKEGVNDTYIIDPIHATSALTYQATKANTTIFNYYSVKDVVFHNDAVAGVAVNWAPIVHEGMHVDPLMITTKAILEGTGHDYKITRVVARKNDIQLNTPTGSVIGERPLDVGLGEQTTVESTKEVYPGLFVSGMAANDISGSFHMGLIFGGTLMSGKKAAELICGKLGN